MSVFAWCLAAYISGWFICNFVLFRLQNWWWSKLTDERQTAIASKIADEWHRMLKNDATNECIVQLIDELRREEADSVAIHSDNPEFDEDGRNSCVDCVGDWTDWREVRFYGRNLCDALHLAVSERRVREQNVSTPAVRDL